MKAGLCLPQSGVTQVYVPPPLTRTGKREQYELVESLYRIVGERGPGAGRDFRVKAASKQSVRLLDQVSWAGLRNLVEGGTEALSVLVWDTWGRGKGLT